MEILLTILGLVIFILIVGAVPFYGVPTVTRLYQQSPEEEIGDVVARHHHKLITEDRP